MSSKHRVKSYTARILLIGAAVGTLAAGNPAEASKRPLMGRMVGHGEKQTTGSTKSTSNRPLMGRMVGTKNGAIVMGRMIGGSTSGGGNKGRPLMGRMVRPSKKK